VKEFRLVSGAAVTTRESQDIRVERFINNAMVHQQTGIMCVLPPSSGVMEAVRTSETSVDNHFTRKYNPEDNSEHHTRRRENLKSHKLELLPTAPPTLRTPSSVVTTGTPITGRTSELYRSDKLARQGWLTGHYRNI
jgi:hypothetical protein